MTKLRESLSSPYFLWALLAVPALPLFANLIGDSPSGAATALHISGEFSARFLIVALLVTPLSLLFRGRRWTQWLLRNRRYFGVASLIYALLHLLAYVVDMSSWSAIVDDLPLTYIWSGWVALLLFLPPGLTSNDGSVRHLGRSWKTVQRLVYPAAALTFLHWISLEEWSEFEPAIIHFAPLVLLSVYRLMRARNDRLPSAAN